MAKIFRVFVDSESESFREQLFTGGNILCNFHIRLGRKPFPSDPWLDFPVIVLSWWLNGFAKLRDAGESVENDFMNGPFDFVTEPKGSRIVISCRQRGSTKTSEIGVPTIVDLQEYRDALLESAVRLSDVAKIAKGKDWDALRAAIRSANS